MAGGVGDVVKRARPDDAELVAGAAIVGKDAGGVGRGEGGVAGARRGGLERDEVAEKDTLELIAVAAAVWLAYVVEDALAVG